MIQHDNQPTSSDTGITVGHWGAAVTLCLIHILTGEEMDLQMGCQSVRLFQLNCSPKVRLHHACLLLLLKLRLALAQYSYHLLLVVSTGTSQDPPRLSLRTLCSPTVFGYIVLATLRGLSHSVVIMQIVKPHESLLSQHGGNEREPLVFHYTDTCQAGFNLIRKDIQCWADWHDKGASQRAL